MSGGLSVLVGFIFGTGALVTSPDQSPMGAQHTATLVIPRQQGSLEHGSPKAIPAQTRARIFAEARQRVTSDLAKQGITILSFGDPKFHQDGSVLWVRFLVQLDLGQSEHTGNTAHVSVKFEEDKGSWRFVQLGTRCCGEH